MEDKPVKAKCHALLAAHQGHTQTEELTHKHTDRQKNTHTYSCKKGNTTKCAKSSTHAHREILGETTGIQFHNRQLKH